MEVATKPKVSAAALPSGKLVELYIQLRDRRALRKAEYENADADDKGKQEKIEGILLQRFNEEGIDSIKTGAGTAYTSTRTSASVADKEVFMAWVRENELWEFLEVRAAKKTVETFREEQNNLPPGINWVEQVTVNVRRS